MIFKKCPPSLGRWFAMSHHVFRHGRFRDLDTQLQYFTMNTRRTPARIVAAQHSDQISNFLRHLGAPRLAAVDSPPPKEAKSFSMPRNDGLDFDDHQGRF